MSRPRKGLVDSEGRVHTYLRVSVTDRCNLRCFYCRPECGVDLKPHPEILRYEEVERLLQLFVGLGIERIRLTGGEPLLRAHLDRLVSSVAQLPGIKEISLTTNGHLLERKAAALARAGLQRVNVSLDSLDPARYREQTRGGDLRPVLRGIEAAREAGLVPVKINTVVLAGLEEWEVLDLIAFCSQHPQDYLPRFIEYMPFEERLRAGKPLAELRALLRKHYQLEPGAQVSGGGPARYWRIADNGLRVGFIAPLTDHFCDHCNRLRLTADGHLRTCLAHDETLHLTSMLRGGASSGELERAIRRAVLAKPGGHACALEGGTPFQGRMSQVGG